MQRVLNQIEMQGHSDEENADSPDQPANNQEALQQNPIPEEDVQQFRQPYEYINCYLLWWSK
jgi:hypothetical protein